MGATSQYHAENSAETTMRTNTTKNAPNCISSGGIANYGYSFTASRNLVVNEAEAPAVRLMFKMFAEHRSYSEIIEALDKLGYKNRSGNKFSQTTIRSMLLNEKYKGTYFYNKKGVRKKKHRVLVKQYDEVVVPNGIPRIITDEEFNQVQEILKNHQITGSKGQITNSAYILTGLSFCAHCGASIHGRSKIAGRSHNRYCHYVCSSVDNPKPGVKCNCKPILKDELEAIAAIAISSLLNQVFSNTNIYSHFKTRIVGMLKDEIENYKRSNNFVEIDKGKAFDKFIRCTDKSLEQALQNRIKNDEQVILNNNKAIDKAKKKLSLIDKKLKEFKEKVDEIDADYLINNKDLLSKLAKRFIKRIEVGDDVVIEFYDF